MFARLATLTSLAPLWVSLALDWACPVLLRASPASAQPRATRSPRVTASPLLVTHPEQGILRVRPDGSVEEVLTRTPATVGRMRDRGRVLFLSPGTNELRELDLTTRAERTVAPLPRHLGPGRGGNWREREPGEVAAEPYLVVDHLQFAESFAADSAHACFEVMDRNLNMVSVIAAIDVDLATGGVTSTVTLSDTCGALERAAIDALACTRVIRDRSRAHRGGGRTRPGSWSFAETADRAFLVDPRGRRHAIALREPAIELVSPSGRWAVVAANRDEGDYIYRSLFLLDLRRGLLFPIQGPGEDASNHTAAWPRPLARRELASAEYLERVGHGVAGETAVRWLGETLVLGERLLVRPGQGSVELPGPLVR